MPPSLHQEIACQQVLADDSSVFSIQWSVFPPEIADMFSAEDLLERYLNYVKSCTFGVIRPLIRESGIEFRLFNSCRSLISFLPPLIDCRFVTLRICGGLLVQPHRCDRGNLRFGVELLADGLQISLQLSGFCPLILGSHPPSFVRFWFYRLTQAAIHRLVTIRFLALLYRELVGTPMAVRVVDVFVREGKPV